MTTLQFQLYGELGEKYGKVFDLQCKTVAQGLNILYANFKGMRKHIIDSDKHLAGYEVWCNEENIEGTRTDLTRERTGVVKVIPVIKGSSANARIIVGAIITAVGIWSKNSNVTAMGISMMAGGIAEKLSAKVNYDPQSDTGKDNSVTSYIFSGAVNNIKQGAAIPVGYGRMIVGSNVVSSSITTVDVPV
jgi:predicted phage tail protein